MKRALIEAVIAAMEQELSRQHNASEQSSIGATHSAPHAEKQRDTTGLEAAYLAHGYAKQCSALVRQIKALKTIAVEDFTDQEIDVGALVEVEMNGTTELYLLLHGGGGLELLIANRTITIITPESPLGQSLMGNIEAGAFSFRSGMEGIILTVS